jgi:hypothetical protein
MISGVQVHAVAGASKPEVVRVNGKACGRLVKTPGQAYVTLSGISGGRQDSGGSRAERAKAMLEKTESHQRFKGFEDVLARYMGNKETAVNELAEDYGDSYLFYYVYDFSRTKK